MQFQTHVMEVIERVAQPIVLIWERGLNEILETFTKRGLQESFSIKDPLQVDEWIVRLEKIFTVFERSGR